MNFIHTIEGLWSNFITLIGSEFYYPHFVLALFVGISVFLIMALIVIMLIVKIKSLKESLPMSHPVNGGMPIEEEKSVEDEIPEDEISIALKREIAKRVGPSIEISQGILEVFDGIIGKLERLEEEGNHRGEILVEIMKEVFPHEDSTKELEETDSQPPHDNAEEVPPLAKENFLVCPKCGAEVLSEDNFCGNCGSEISKEKGSDEIDDPSEKETATTGKEIPVATDTPDPEPQPKPESGSEPKSQPKPEPDPKPEPKSEPGEEVIEHPGEPLTRKEKEETPLLDENLDEEFISRNRKGMVGKKAKEKITAPGDESIIIVDKDEKITPEILDNALKYRVFLQLMRNLK